MNKIALDRLADRNKKVIYLLGCNWQCECAKLIGELIARKMGLTHIRFEQIVSRLLREDGGVPRLDPAQTLALWRMRIADDGLDEAAGEFTRDMAIQGVLVERFERRGRWVDFLNAEVFGLSPEDILPWGRDLGLLLAGLHDPIDEAYQNYLREQRQRD